MRTVDVAVNSGVTIMTNRVARTSRATGVPITICSRRRRTRTISRRSNPPSGFAAELGDMPLCNGSNGGKSELRCNIEAHLMLAVGIDRNIAVALGVAVPQRDRGVSIEQVPQLRVGGEDLVVARQAMEPVVLVGR